MKLVHFIVVALCVSLSIAGAEPPRVAQYRKAYEATNDPALLVRIAHEYRLAGDARQALASFCSYMYVDAAGPLADEASANARAIAAKLGYSAQSDHDACSARPRASQPAVAKPVQLTAPAPPPRITKREVAGLVIIGGSVTSLGLALLEARKLQEIRDDIETTAPGTNMDALEAREDRAALKQKLYLAGGGVALITGGLLYVLGRNDRKRAERAYVAPSLTKTGGGLVFGGRF